VFDIKGVKQRPSVERATPLPHAGACNLKSEAKIENRSSVYDPQKMGKRVSLCRYRFRCFFFALKYKNSVFQKKFTDWKFAS
jgi:hypothetical protein